MFTVLCVKAYDNTLVPGLTYVIADISGGMYNVVGNGESVWIPAEGGYVVEI